MRPLSRISCEPTRTTTPCSRAFAKTPGITSGFCGADLANLVNEAALLAARNDKPSVGMDEFNEAVERVTAGLEKKKRVIHEDEKKRVAYHEAAHALVAY